MMPQVIEVPGVGQVEFPDGMTDEQIVSAIRRNQPREPQPEGLYDASTLGGATVNLVGAAIEPLGVLASGAVALPIAGLTRIGTTIAEEFGLDGKTADDIVRRVQETLTYNPVTEAGKIATEAITSPFELLAKGADVAGEGVRRAGEAVGLSPEAAAGPATAVNTAIQAVPALLGAKGARGLKPSPPSAIRSRVASIAHGVAAPVRNVADVFTSGGSERAAGRLLRDVAGERAPAVIAELEQPAGRIPQTAGERAVPAGSTEFSAVQNIVERVKPSQYADKRLSAEEARKTAIGEVAKSPEELAAAIKTRKENAAQAYGKVGNQVVPIDAGLTTILNRPSMETALRRAEDIANEFGEPFSASLDGSGAATAYPVRSLHYVKMALDDMVRSPEQFGIGRAETAAILGTQKALLGWLKNKAPGYDAARAQFKAESVPINQMQVGQELQSRLTSGLEAERPAAFATAVKDAPKLIKTATDHPRYQELSEVLNPKQMEVVDLVVQNLQNKAKFDLQARQGSTAAQKQVGMETPFVPPTGILNPHISFARGVINRLSGKASDRILNSLAEIMLDPRKTAEVMRSATPQERKIIQRVLRLRDVGIAGAVVSAEQN